VLVRYLAQDDPAQSGRATDLIERRLSERDPRFISIVAMVETVWVLQHAYNLTSPAVAAVIERTLQAGALIVENEQEVFTAMIALKEGQGSFADVLIGPLGSKAGCSVTVTFDRSASRLSDFELL